MARSTQQTINIISISITCFIAFLLLFFNAHFSSIQVFILLCLMMAFMFILVKDTKQNQPHPEMYDRRSTDERSEPSRGLAYKLNGILSDLSSNIYNQSSKNMWRMDRTYAEDIEENIRSGSKSVYNNKPSLSEQEEYELRKRQFNIGLPQSISSVIEEIKQSIQPYSFIQMFNREFEVLKKKNTKGNLNGRESINFEEVAPNQSYSLDGKSLNFTLTADYEVSIDDPVYTTEIVGDFMKEKIDVVIRNSHYSFKVVFQTMMKCFGLKVNFGGSQKMGRESREVTMEQVRDFLIKFRRSSTIQNFKLLVSFQQFTTVHLERLVRSTDNVMGLIQHMDNQSMMALKIYVDVLNETFKDEYILMSDDKSAYSPEMRKAKHVFYVHQSGRSVFFTYNRMGKFKTNNPILAVVAFFTENFKAGKYDSIDIVRNLARRFNQKPKLA